MKILNNITPIHESTCQFPFRFLDRLLFVGIKICIHKKLTRVKFWKLKKY